MRSAPTRDCLRTRAAAFEQGTKGLEFGKETWEELRSGAACPLLGSILPSSCQLQAFSRLLTFGRDYAVGATQVQQSQPSAEKLTRQKCRAIDPSGLLIVYSLGDELYKWCPVEG